jgi:hypothetical protein
MCKPRRECKEGQSDGRSGADSRTHRLTSTATAFFTEHQPNLGVSDDALTRDRRIIPPPPGQILATEAFEEKPVQLGNVRVQGQFHRAAGGGFIR